MGQSVNADFFMDDYFVIIDHDYIHEGEWFAAELRQIPYLIWTLIHRSFGYSPLPFHVATFSLHLLCTILVANVAFRFATAASWFGGVTQRQIFSFYSALVFAVHPASTEAVNYARCLQIGLVTFFCLVAATGTLRALTSNGRSKLLGIALTLVGILGASLSKQPGVIHALATVAIIALPLTVTRWKYILGSFRDRDTNLLLAAGSFLISAPILAPTFRYWLEKAISQVLNPEYVNHVLTQGRVFWLYAQRLVLPRQLSSDHWIMETVSAADTSAVLQAVATAALCIVTAVFIFRKRTRFAAIAISLALAPLLLRFLYINLEPMVEYRLHPSMPWVAIGFGAAFFWLHQQRWLSLRLVPLIVCAAFTLLSAQRCVEWTDHGTMCAKNLAQYPLNNRARCTTANLFLQTESWAEVLAVADDATEAFMRIQKINESSKVQGRGYNPIRILTDLSTCLEPKIYALSHTASVGDAIKFADSARSVLNHYRYTNSTDKDDRLLFDERLVEARVILSEFGTDYRKREFEVALKKHGIEISP